jgi:hypothetical protein
MLKRDDVWGYAKLKGEYQRFGAHFESEDRRIFLRNVCTDRRTAEGSELHRLAKVPMRMTCF